MDGNGDGDDLRVSRTSVSARFHCFHETLHLKLVVVSFFLTSHLRPLDPLYQNLHHVVPIEQKCPSLAAVVKSVASDVLGNAHVYKRYVHPVLYP